jgi:hypothetical protein
MDTGKEDNAVQNIQSNLDTAIILLSTIPNSGSANDLTKQYETEKFCFEWRTQNNPEKDNVTNKQFLVKEFYNPNLNTNISPDANRKKLLDTKG